MIDPNLTTKPLRHDEQANEDYYDCRRSLLASSSSAIRAAALEATKAVSLASGGETFDKTSACSSDQETDDTSYHSDRGRIHFSDCKLYGRDDELRRLKELYRKIVMTDEEGNTSTTTMDTSSMHSTVCSDDGRFSVASSNSKSDREDQSGLGQVVFLPGYSGSGKSSLVREFLKQLQESETIHPPWFIVGKHDEHFKADPYSAIADGISRFFTTTILPWSVVDESDDVGTKNDREDDVETTLACHRKRKEFVALQGRLNEALGDYGNILIDIIPNLAHVLGKTNSSDASATCSLSWSKASTGVDGDDDGNCVGSSSFSISSNTNSATKKKSKNCKAKSADILKQVFRNFMTALCTKDHPVVLFLDDLQWMDEATMDLISTLLADVNMKHLMFIGSYRSNEVDDKEDHPVSILTRSLKERGRQIEYLQLQDLSADHIGEFIADSLNMEVDEVEPLTKEIHSRTLGNIFYTMQALDELVRRNNLYYDMVMFRWQWNLDKLEAENHLSDIVTMIKAKLVKLPKSVRGILTVASYTRSTVDIGTLWKLVSAVVSNTVKRYEDLEIGLDRAVRHGLMTSRRFSDDNATVVEYSFSHDLIQEASQTLVAEEDKNHLRLRIANRLEQLSQTDQRADWMLFAAIHHLNALPVEFLTTEDPTAMIRIAQINLRAAKLAIDRSAFRQAVDLVRSGVGCLEIGMKGRKWAERYDLCLELFNCLLETEFMVGNHDQAQLAVNEVLTNAHNENDKLLAQFYHIEICTNGKDHSYDRAIELAIECLACHGVILPAKPGDARLVKERISLQLLQGRRSLLDIMDGQHMSDYEEDVMRLFSQLSHSALLAGNINLCTLVNLTAMRRSWEQGMNIYLPNMLAYYGSVLRKQGKWTEASKVAFAAEEMLNKMGGGFAWTQGVAVVVGGVSPMRKSFSTCRDISSEAHRVGVSCGKCWWALCNAMQYSLFHFCAGFPLHAVFEAKVLHFEGQVKSFGLGASLEVAFQVFRQTVLNLRGKGGSSPTLFRGKAVHEARTLKKFSGDSLKQTLRDISIFRLMLACVYGDESCMLEMIVERFSPHPEYDIVVPRQHLRDVFLGLAAFLLARKSADRKTSKMLTKLGRDKLNLYQKLSKIGSENAPPILSCLKAVEKPTRDSYDKAIETCSMSGLLHLEGIMSEWCGLHLLQDDSTTQEVAESYIARAMKAYNKWGATGKVSQMKERHTFLSNVRCKQNRSGSVACVPSFDGRGLSYGTQRRISCGL